MTLAKYSSNSTCSISKHNKNTQKQAKKTKTQAWWLGVVVLMV